MAQGPSQYSQYPNGFNYLTLKNVPVTSNNSGNVYWVNNSSVLPVGGVAGVNSPYPTAGSFLRPFNTIDYAIGQCVAGRGDVIMVMPNHVEDLDAANDIDADVDNIVIQGLGVGTDQAKITFSNTAATFRINADNVTVTGLNFEATISAVVLGINLVAGSNDCRIVGNRFTSETITTDEFLDSISVTTSHRTVIADNIIDMDAGGAESGIHLVGACLGAQILNNYIVGAYSAGCIEHITTAAKEIVIDGNTLINGLPTTLNTVGCIVMLTGTTGVIQNNNLYTNVASPSTGAIVADGCFLGGLNFISSTAETAPIQPEASGVTSGPVYATGKAAVADEATATLWTVTGNINVYGIIGHASTAFNSAVQVSLTTDCTVEALNSTLSTAVECQVLTVVGDTVNSAQVGSILVATEAPGDITPLWTGPTIVPAGLIQQTIGGTPGTGAMSYTLFWSPATAGASVA